MRKTKKRGNEKKTSNFKSKNQKTKTTEPKTKTTKEDRQRASSEILGLGGKETKFSGAHLVEFVDGAADWDNLFFCDAVYPQKPG